MRRVAVAGLVLLASVVGCVVVPAGARAEPVAARAAAISLQAGAPTISCVTTADCLAIGGGGGLDSSAVPVPARVARWNGTSWKGVGLTVPTGYRYAELDGLSCRGAKFCVAAGLDDVRASGSGLVHALALAYNGSSLRPMTLPLPRSTIGSSLTAVSCATARNCVAVGGAGGDTAAFGKEGSVALVETWNGSRWTLHTVSAPGRTIMLSNVSCTPAGFCMVAGDSFNASFKQSLYVASWNGRKLTTLKAPAVDATNLEATMGLSCATSSDCALVGAVEDPGSSAFASTAFAYIWNGRTWQRASVRWPKGTTSSDLADVSCRAAGRCEAVGSISSAPATSFSPPTEATAVALGGTAGTVQPVRPPSTGYSDRFDAVSCLPWGTFVAVGQIGKTTANSWPLMTGVWNTKAWKLGPGL
jgi:hypothetical protein